jgi:N-acetylglucosaminyldiphosphoundecaprenol N-acetyl-beta-D-mannosaminyltransferase
MHPTRIPLLGGEVDLVTPDDVLAFTAERIAAGAKGIVANHNLHSLALLRRDPGMRAFYDRADVIEADGTPLIAWGALLGRGLSRAHRCTYLDWRERFWALAVQHGWRVFYLGGGACVAANGAEAVRRRWPGVQPVGTADGFFDMDGPDNDWLVQRINTFRPDVLFVGMGMPRQERWILANYDRLEHGVVFPVGAAFDYEAGAVPTPPRWAGPLGVEWLFRLAAEPRRLAHRYLVEPWSLLPAAVEDLRLSRGLKPETPRPIRSSP